MSEKINRKRTLKIAISLLFAGIVVCILLFVFWMWYLGRYDQVDLYPNGGVEVFYKTDYFRINPETILTALERGETDVFTPQIATPEAPVEHPVEWHQSDFMKVFSALHQFVWHETLGDWRPGRMNFTTTCHDRPDGFTRGEFLYFKTIPVDWLSGDYMLRGALVSTEYGVAIAGMDYNYPEQLFDKWKYIDLDRVKISAEDALRIAEENGGQEARLAVQNNCTIEVRLAGYYTRGWWVTITKSKTAFEILELHIDPYTGEVTR